MQKQMFFFWLCISPPHTDELRKLLMMWVMLMMMMVMMIVVVKVKRPSWKCTGAACSLSSGQSSTVAGEPKFNAPKFFLSLIRLCQDIYCDQNIHAPHYPSKIKIWTPKTSLISYLIIHNLLSKSILRHIFRNKMNGHLVWRGGGWEQKKEDAEPDIEVFAGDDLRLNSNE